MAEQDLPRGGFEIRRDLRFGSQIEKVFDFLTDPTRFAIVDLALIDVEPKARLELGAAGRMMHRRGGMTARTAWSVTAFEPPHAVTVAIVGSGYAMTESAALKSTLDGTMVTFIDRVWPTSIPGRLLVALSRGIMQRDLEARAARLAAALET